MRPQPQFDKVITMMGLKRGDIVKLVTGETAEFQSLKQKNFIGIIKGSTYNIPINHFQELVAKSVKIDKTSEVMTLNSGELFYIIKGDNVMVFKFDRIINNKIHCKNPITNGGVTMSLELYAGKVSDL